MPPSRYLLSAALLAVTVTWVASGQIGRTADGAVNPTPAPRPEPAPMTVQVRVQHAEAIARELVVQGQVEPGRSVVLKAETAGAVAEVLAERGRKVLAGDPVVRLAMNDRSARLARAEALVSQRRQDLAAFQRLGQSGFQAQTQLNQARADQAEAEAELEHIRLDIARTEIVAPFAGVLETRAVELGTVVAVGDPIATIVDTDPLIAVAQVPQTSVGTLEIGSPARVRLATGDTAEGRIRFVSANADSATRTFRVEVEIANPDARLKAGVSAELRIPRETEHAHFISPAQLTLASDGTLGVLAVDGDSRAVFHPVRIVRSAVDGLWVADLPETVRLITLGQGFVQPGERVTVLADDTGAGTAIARCAGEVPCTR